MTRGAASGRSDRLLVYVEPSGRPDPRSRPRRVDAARRSTVAVLKGTVASRINGENINVDIEAIEAHNEAIAPACAIRSVSLAWVGRREFLKVGPTDWSVYRETRSAVHAERICSLLQDPLETLGEDPFPQAIGRSPHPRRRVAVTHRPVAPRRWPVSGSTRRSGPRAAVGTRRRSRAKAPTVFRSADPLERVTLLLLEWVRYLESAGVDGWPSRRPRSIGSSPSSARVSSPRSARRLWPPPRCLWFGRAPERSCSPATSTSASRAHS